ncbi:MAG: caspase family protein [Desulfovibrio sp.]|nr:caspase family protein [Desulfovibrio sp.]
MRKALVVGIDHYTHIPGLFGCVNDAHAVKSVLEKHSDGSVNFGVMPLMATGSVTAISRGDLKDRVEELFKDDSDIALLYFAGHGHIDSTGGYLCGSDCKRGDDGLSLGDVLTLANASKAKNKVIVLDSCHSGIAGTPAGHKAAELAEGMTILTASTKEQYASEENGSGVFTTLFVDALNGAAGNLVGDVTPGSVYAHVDQSLGPWKQRPVFKTNVKTFVSLRKVQPPIELTILQRLNEFFPQPGFEFKLDPTFEPELTGRPAGAPPPILENTKKFSVLQKYNRVGLLVPVDAPHMWHAAMESKVCKLTVLGEHYRRLVEDELI